MGLGAVLAGGGAILAGAIAWAKRRLSDDATTTRLLRREPTTPIRDAQDLTRAKFVGTAEVDAPELKLPFTGEACLAYRIDIWQRNKGKERVLLEPLLRVRFERDAEMVSFFVRDESGVARVDGRVEALALTALRIDLPESAVNAFLASKGLPQGKETQVRIGVLRAGDRVAVHGLVTMESSADAPAAGFRGPLQRPLMGPNRTTGLLISNHPEIDPPSWV